MPIYEYLLPNGEKIERLFKYNEAPQIIMLNDNIEAKRIISKSRFMQATNNIAQEDQKKIREDRKHYMQQYDVESFVPLRGQSEEQAFQDFKQTKYLHQQQILRKQQLRRQHNRKKWDAKRASFKKMQEQWYHKQQEKKERQFTKNKMSL